MVAYRRDEYERLKEAYQAFLDLKAKNMIPIHYGTFKLTDESINEPYELMMKIDDTICYLAIGELRLLQGDDV